MGRGPQFEKNDSPHPQMAGYGPVKLNAVTVHFINLPYRKRELNTFSSAI